MRTDELDYELPRERIATMPAKPRDAARLMVVRISEPDAAPIHAHVRDLPEFLGPDDTLALNTTRTLPARFLAKNRDTGGQAEGLWLRDGEPGEDGSPTWVCMVKARRHRPGWTLDLLRESGERTDVAIELIERTDEPGEEGAWRCAVRTDLDTCGPELLERAGMTALPPYIRSARKEMGLAIDDSDDRGDYQTVYAASCVDDHGGSVAAPTAGLHFTPELLARLGERGVGRADVTLHVGAGTFKPIDSETLEEHTLHAEWCAMGDGAHGQLFGKSSADRVIAVGTTSVRTIEAFAIEHDAGRRPEWLSTDLMIAPGFQWRRVQGMMTNFHLPKSSLMALVAARLEAPGVSVSGVGVSGVDGLDRLKRIYQEAIDHEYRFYSYGDAMLILP